MNRQEYMRALGYKLKRLPKEDYDRAMDYFEEYFEEAGVEKEAQAIEDLGAPEMAADQVIRDFAAEYARQPEENVKKSFSGVWVAILAVLAAPIGLPLAIAAVALGVVMLAVVAAVLLSVVIVSVSLTAVSLPCVAGGIWLFFIAPADGILTLGAGLVCTGVGIWSIMGCTAFGRWCLHGMTKFFGKVAGGQNYEK